MNKKKETFEDMSNDSIFSDDKSINKDCNSNNSNNQSVDLNDPMALFNHSNKLKNNNYHEQKFLSNINNQDNLNGPGFLTQFDELQIDNPSDPVSANNVPNKIGNNADLSKIEMERDIALQGEYSNYNSQLDMSYGVVKEQNFVHNNMTPYFKQGLGKGYGQDSAETNHLNDIKQRKLDLHSGSTQNLSFRHKTERRPLFNPQTGTSWIYGTPSYTDMMETRFIPGKERRNEMLTQPTRVTPGLNLGYNEVSSQGLNDNFRVLMKNVNDLRTANNPKISYPGVIIPGKKGIKRPILPNIAKRKPLTFYELDPKDNIKSLGDYRAPRIQAEVKATVTNRQDTSKPWYGPAEIQIQQAKPENMIEKFKKPNRQNYGSAGPRNISSVDKEKTGSYSETSFYCKPTIRETTENNTFINPASPEYKKGYVFDPINNTPDLTMRNLSENINWLNAVSSQNKNGYISNPNDIPQPTLRNITETNTNLNNIISPNKNGYVINPKDIPDPTLRELVEKNINLNNIVPGFQKGYIFDPKDIPDPTLRELIEKNTNLNNVSPGLQKGYTFNPKDIPDPTKRNITEQNTNINNIMSLIKKGYLINPNDISDPNLRELIEKNTNLNNIVPGYQKGYAIDPKDVPDPTKRNLTEHNINLNNIMSLIKKGCVINPNDIPDPTLRELVEKNININNIKPTFQKGYTFDPKDIPDPTKRNLIEKNTNMNNITTFVKNGFVHNPKDIPDPTKRNLTETNSNLNNIQTQYKKTYSMDYTNIPETTLRELTQNIKNIGPVSPIYKEKGGYQIEVQNTRAPITLRQMTQDKTYQSPLKLQGINKQRTREDACNFYLNEAKEKNVIIRDGGAPTTRNYDKGPTMDYTIVQLCNPIEINREQYGQMVGLNPLGSVSTSYTRKLNEIPQVNFRMDNSIQENLKSNPYAIKINI